MCETLITYKHGLCRRFARSEWQQNLQWRLSGWVVIITSLFSTFPHFFSGSRPIPIFRWFVGGRELDTRGSHMTVEHNTEDLTSTAFLRSRERGGGTCDDNFKMSQILEKLPCFFFFTDQVHPAGGGQRQVPCLQGHQRVLPRPAQGGRARARGQM